MPCDDDDDGYGDYDNNNNNNNNLYVIQPFVSICKKLKNVPVEKVYILTNMYRITNMQSSGCIQYLSFCAA
jgi:hypothetical protein